MINKIFHILRVNKRSSFLFLMLILTSLAIYLPSSNNFFIVDDFEFIDKAKQVGSFQDLIYFSKDSVGAIKAFRPVINISFFIDHFLWSNNPFGYHLTNIIFHTLSAIFIFLIIKLILKRKWVAFVTAIAFTVFPTNYESVSWIAGRTDVICTFFYLLSLWLLIKYISSEFRLFYIILSIIAYGFSVLSKEIGLTLPLVGIIIIFIYIHLHPDKNADVYKKILGSFIFFLIIPIGYLILRKLAIGELVGGYYFMENSIFEQIKDSIVDYLTLPLSFIEYILNYRFIINENILPVNNPLNFIRNIKILSLFLVLITLVLNTWRNNKLRKVILGSSIVGLLWIYLTAIPEAHLLSTIGKDQTQENIRYLYLPSIGFVFILASVLSYCVDLVNRNNKIINIKYINYAISTLIIILLSVATYLNSMPHAIAAETSNKIITDYQKILNSNKENVNYVYLRSIPKDYYGAFISIPNEGYKLFSKSNKTDFSQLYGQENDVILNSECNYSTRNNNNTYYLRWDEEKEALVSDRERTTNFVSNWSLNDNRMSETSSIVNEGGIVSPWTPYNYAFIDKSPLILEQRGRFLFIENEELNIKSSDISKINIVYKIGKSEEKNFIGRFSWVSDKDPYSLLNTIQFPIIRDGDFHKATIKTCSYPNWVFSNIIKKIKISFHIDNNSELKIQEIKLND